jgi:hypothetical protein
MASGWLKEPVNMLNKLLAWLFNPLGGRKVAYVSSLIFLFMQMYFVGIVVLSITTTAYSENPMFVGPLAQALALGIVGAQYADVKLPGIDMPVVKVLAALYSFYFYVPYLAVLTAVTFNMKSKRLTTWIALFAIGRIVYLHHDEALTGVDGNGRVTMEGMEDRFQVVRERFEGLVTNATNSPLTTKTVEVMTASTAAWYGRLNDYLDDKIASMKAPPAKADDGDQDIDAAIPPEVALFSSDTPAPTTSSPKTGQTTAPAKGKSQAANRSRSAGIKDDL